MKKMSFNHLSSLMSSGLSLIYATWICHWSLLIWFKWASISTLKNGVTFSLVFIAVPLRQDTALHFHTTRPYSAQGSWCYTGIPVLISELLLCPWNKANHWFLSGRRQEKKWKPMDPFPMVLRFYYKNAHQGFPLQVTTAGRTQNEGPDVFHSGKDKSFLTKEK